MLKVALATEEKKAQVFAEAPSGQSYRKPKVGILMTTLTRLEKKIWIQHRNAKFFWLPCRIASRSKPPPTKTTSWHRLRKPEIW